jgi:hypothetical protein
MLTDSGPTTRLAAELPVKARSQDSSASERAKIEAFVRGTPLTLCRHASLAFAAALQ